MTVALRTITRLQDADDAPALGAGQNGYTLTWNNATGAFEATALFTGGLLATGATTGATSQAQLFAIGVITPAWRPVADGTDALLIQSASGASVAAFDTTNGIFRVYDAARAVLAHIKGANSLSSLGIGFEALNALISGQFNTALGHRAMLQTTSGASNVAVGALALYSNTTGPINTALGREALYSNQTGSSNSAFGYAALYKNTSGGFNMAIGRQAMYENLTGTHNAAIGYQSLYYNTSGTYNSVIGAQALLANTTGSHDIAIGHEAGRYQADGSALTDAENSIYIGRGSRGFSNADDNSIVIGYNAIGRGANTTVIGNSSTTLTALGGAVELTERGAPSGSANKALIYARDDGAGKTLLCCKLGDDVEIVLATQA